MMFGASVRHGVFALLATALACGPSPAPASSGAGRASVVPSSPRSSARCDTSKSALAVTLEAKHPVATPAGIEVTFVGAGHDDFADGRFDDWVEVRFRRGDESISRIMSVYGDHPTEEVLGACWRLTSAGAERIALTLYPRRADAP